ncbi:MAG: M48 family metalloprotease [Nostocaceae cyanobacterium]|nr:M48 family metalloprotease [Nostocaceae cyanobacterium]
MVIKHHFIKLNLVFASVITILFLIILLSIPFLGLMLLSESIPVTFIVFLSITSNIILFFKSPSLMDSALKNQYSGINWETPQYIQDTYPLSYKCIQRICRKYKISEPRIAIVEDKVPLAFTYGNYLNNARIVITTELLNLLTDEELAAVYAHELGHIARHDFAVMTLAQTLTISLYMLGIGLIRSNNSGSNLLAVKAIGLASLVFYYIAFLASLYLSRVREFSADHFAAKNVNDPNSLSRALVKIVYQSVLLKRINAVAQSARALNIFDFSVKKLVSGQKRQEAENYIQNLLYPSSRWEELMSTHPFPINRINALSYHSKQKGINVGVNIPEIISNLKESEIASEDTNSKSEHLTNSNPQTESRSEKILMRRNSVLFASVSLMLIIVSVFYFINNNSTQDKTIAIFCLLLGITCLVAFINSIYQSPGYIILSNVGIEIHNPKLFGKKGRQFFFKWSDIEEIEVSEFFGAKQIGFNFYDSYTGEMQNYMNINQVFTGYHFCLGNDFNQKPKYLRDKIQKWKDFYS